MNRAKFTNRFIHGAAASAALFFGGCMVGPDYEQPTAPVEPTWKDSAAEQEDILEPVVPPTVKWWSESFHDPVLDDLIEQALVNNYQLESAALRVLQAQQRLAIAIGNEFPQQQQVTGGASRQKSNGATFNNFNIGFNVGWELDLWGRFRREVLSAQANVDASIAAYDGVLVSVASQVAQNYLLIRTFQQRLIVTRRNLEYQKESVRITQVKADIGAVTDLDVDQAQAIYYNTEALISGYEVSLQQFKNNLAILLGQPPGEFDYLLAEPEAIPLPPVEVGLGMPQDLIRRRPDIRVAERSMAAQSERIGVAFSELLPSITIGGGLGTAATDFNKLFANSNQTWQLYGLFEWNVLNYGRLMNNVRLQDATFQQLVSDYRQTVLSAQADVENALIAYLKAHQQMRSYEKSSSASQRAVDLAQIQYEQGSIPFNTVINTLQSNLAQQDLLVASQGSVGTNLVQLYLALGGGWEIREGVNPVEYLPESTVDAMQARTGIWEHLVQEDEAATGSAEDLAGDSVDESAAADDVLLEAF
ncbi:efflux transporter outer membrane subunit [Cerasicoccus maritimus]|uniref:efflux transporter outer membrane subunit n=1 Tax=Cerasicoccus maritimus TaxID=490089 RepID=UPI0028526821|nr:efflux transporter outer membrane subunit [Cerasicoccus maritimus]